MKKSKLLRFISLGVLCALVFSLLPAYTPAANSTPTKLVALTFDDGPSKYTPRLLDGLKERGAKATFFMLGNCANTYPSTVKRAYEEGHQIASHTYDHPRLTTLSDAQVSSQVSRTKSALDSAIGAGNKYVLRPPYGDYNSRVLGQLGTAAIYWSVDSNDWRWTNNATKTVSEIKKNVFDGAIILLHDSHSWSVDAALTVIDDLQAQGYEFVTVSELFRRRGGSLSSGQIYYSKKSSGSDLPAINAPTVTLSVSGSKSYAVMSGDAGTDIYYTVDGSVPNANSKKYT
ncbi:MAG: polysaccharide deacetylase family protein, partial [Clostridia bacterium]|nr:polysaccharide deacetylase family protein [Clostridia bacterium]